MTVQRSLHQTQTTKSFCAQCGQVRDCMAEIREVGVLKKGDVYETRSVVCFQCAAQELIAWRARIVIEREEKVTK